MAIDRHLGRAFIKLSWVHPQTTDKEEMAVMIQDWLPHKHWSTGNNTIAGLNQLLQNKDQKPIVVSVAEQIGASSLVNRLILSLPHVK